MAQEDQSGRAGVEAEAAAWLVRLEAGTADFSAFEAWRSASPAHAAAFAQLDAAWTRLDRAAALRPPGVPNPNLFARSDKEGAKEEADRSRRWLLRAAAVAGLSIAGASGVAFVMMGRASAETGIGERRTMRLPDGSLLDLNTDSRASWRFSDAERKVWLERGEVALEIVADAARPFLLAAGKRSVELNTGVFNARLRRGGAEIAVLRGAAEVAGEAPLIEGRAVLLEASGSTVAALSPAAVDATAAWRRGEIIFDGDTIEEAVAEYNRYLTAKIEIDDPAIASIRLGGRFETRDPAEFLTSLESAFPVRVARAGDGTVHLQGQRQRL